MSTLFILNDAPYGTERCSNALKLAHALRKRNAVTAITVFLMADAVIAARTGQKTPDGNYNIEWMLKRLVAEEGRVLLCGVCMDARGIGNGDVVDGACRSAMDELAAVTAEADNLLVF